MKITDRNRPFVFTIFFILLSFVLPFFAIIVCMIDQGSASRVVLYKCNVCMYLANWPSLLLKIYPTIIALDGTAVYSAQNAIFNPKVIIVNAIGWCLIGFIVGLIISAVKGRKQQRFLTTKE